MRDISESDLRPRIKRLDVLVDGFAKEVDTWRTCPSPLTDVERKR
jgi:hypothetical protein